MMCGIAMSVACEIGSDKFSTLIFPAIEWNVKAVSLRRGLSRLKL